MLGLLLRVFAITFVGLTLAACGTHPKPMPEVQEIYDIRGLAVTANDKISRVLLAGIQQRLDKAIEDTNRPALMPRAVMNVQILAMTKATGYDGTRAETEVNVTLTDVTSGQPLQVRGFLIDSFSITARDANESAAEAIASRLRVEYALTQPSIRQVPATTGRLSTRLRDDTIIPLGSREDKPLVIPLRTAPAIGADQDPMLNSKTGIATEKQDLVTPDKKAASTGTDPKVIKPVAAENAVEAGAHVKVVIKPKAALPAADEPCVETMDKKC